MPYLDGLWVVDMVTEVHQDLGHEVRDVVGVGLHQGTEAQHPCVPLNESLQGQGVGLQLTLLHRVLTQHLKVLL